MSLLAKRWNQKGKVIIHPQTTDEPISLIGEMAGICYGADTEDEEKNYQRGLDCIKSDHGRTLEFVQVYLIVSEHSARVIREFERHIGGAPTFLQESTRYIDYENFKYITPPSIEKNQEALEVYNDLMRHTSNTASRLKELGIPKEDIGMVYPLAMETKIVHRTNLRNLIDMSRVRECSRAYWEFRDLFEEFKTSIAIYSDQWNYLVNELKIFHPKCEEYGYCNEKKSCGRMPKKGDINA